MYNAGRLKTCWMHSKFRIKCCDILHGLSKRDKCYICLTVFREKSVLWFSKTKTQGTPQVKQKPLDPHHVQDNHQEPPWDSNTSIIFNWCQDKCFISPPYVHSNNNKNKKK